MMVKYKVIKVNNEMDYNVILATLRDEYHLEGAYKRIMKNNPYYPGVKGIGIVITHRINIETWYTTPPGSISCVDFIYMSREEFLFDLLL